MATIGYTSGTTSLNSETDATYAIKCPDTPSGDGTILSITVKCKNTAGGEFTIEVGMYADNGSGAPGALIYNSGAIAVAGGFDGEKTQSGLSINVTSGTQYWMACRPNIWAIQLYYEGNTEYMQAVYRAATWPDPYGSPTAAPDHQFVVYATYTVGGGTTPITGTLGDNANSYIVQEG